MASTGSQSLILPKTALVKQKVAYLDGHILFDGPDKSVCYCGIVGWCSSHMSECMQNGKDLASLFEEREEGVLSIPFVPTSKLWVDVDFHMVAPGAWSFEVSDEQVVKSDADRFLGVLSHYEGRLVVRSMMNAWFKSQGEVDQRCHSGVHSFREQKKIDASLKFLTFLVGNNWYLKWYKVCIFCYHKGKSVSDLIPEGDKPRSWSEY